MLCSIFVFWKGFNLCFIHGINIICAFFRGHYGFILIFYNICLFLCDPYKDEALFKAKTPTANDDARDSYDAISPGVIHCRVSVCVFIRLGMQQEAIRVHKKGPFSSFSSTRNSEWAQIEAPFLWCHFTVHDDIECPFYAITWKISKHKPWPRVAQIILAVIYWANCCPLFS